MIAPRALRVAGLWIGIAILGAILAAALAAPLLTPHDPYEQDLLARLRQPFWHDGADPLHPFGTDHLGRDYLSRLLYGARVSLLIGAAVVAISGLIGTTLGVVGGYLGGRVDMVVSYLLTVRLAVPVVLVALAVVALVGASLANLVLVLGLLLWDRFAVVVRTATRQIREMEFVAAAEAVGATRLRIVLGEVLPNLRDTLAVVATVEMAQAILLEAALSFLGLGVQSPVPSWGLMVAEGKENILFEPWLIALPGALLLALVLAINLLGDALRDLLAPEERA
ncbi:MAG: ABC transporter permease [Alphaproteobacteria bacterium]|nr:ABC transporter permease [Alphaproteobacteria bacterium]